MAQTGLRELRRAFYQAEDDGKIDRKALVMRAYNIAMKSRLDVAALRAIELIWERWFGKQPTELVGRDGEALFGGLTREEQLTQVRALLGLVVPEATPPADKDVN